MIVLVRLSTEQDPRAFLQLVCVDIHHPTILLGSCSPSLTHRRFNRLSYPILSIAGQRLVLNLRELQARLLQYTSSYVSRVVDQELAAMDGEWWHPVGGLSAGTGTTDLALELLEVRRDEEQSPGTRRVSV